MCQLKPAVILAALLFHSLPAFTDDAITTVMSPIVSYQYLDDLTTQALTTGGISSPIASYQYFEWPGDDVLKLLKSDVISFYYDGSPTIILQPASQLARVGDSVSLRVEAAGAQPLSYQWNFNGNPIPGATLASLTLDNLKLGDSGAYSAVVVNLFGSAESSVSHVNAFLPPSTPQPSPPAAIPTTAIPPAAFTTPPRKPTSAQMVVFNDGGLLDRNKMTIVLTHGWIGSSTGWPTEMKKTLVQNGFDAFANIVAWDWTDNANTLSPSTAAVRAPSEGEALGSTLLSTLGASYNKPIHFLGHSLGTIVNCRAADYIHGDAKNSPGRIPGSSLKFSPANTQMTLFDEAELVTAVNGVHFMLGSSLNPDTAENLVQNFWSKVIPDHSAWIDNYLSEVGVPHAAAANVLLWRNAALGIQGGHGYSYQWYGASVANPNGGPMGHRWSFEENSLATAPARGSYFLQEVNSDPWTLELSQLQLDSVSQFAVSFPTLAAYRGLNALGSSAFGLYSDAIQYAGNFVDNTVEMFRPLNGQPVFVGTADSTPAYYVQKPSSQAFTASWDFQFTLQAPASPNLPKSRRDGVSPAGNDPSDSFVYASIPIVIPREAIGMSFEFGIQGSNTNEFFTMGISNQNYLTIETAFLDKDVWTASSVIEIAQYSGQRVPILFALNGESGPPTGKLSVRGIQFYSPPIPSVQIVLQGTNAVLSWPILASGWTLESADGLSSVNRWADVTNVAAAGNYQFNATVDILSETKFFRLRR